LILQHTVQKVPT